MTSFWLEHIEVKKILFFKIRFFFNFIYLDDIEPVVRDLMSSYHENFKILSLKPCLGQPDEICDQVKNHSTNKKL